MDPNRSKWIEAIEKIQPFDYITQTYYVCRFHFLPKDIQKRGRKNFVISGRVPSIFPNSQSNENVNSQCSNVSVIEVNGNSCESTIAVDSAQSSVENNDADEEPTEGRKANSFDSESSIVQCSNMHAIELIVDNCQATILNSTDVHDEISDLFDYCPEYLSENSLNTDHETISEDKILITKAEYKKLMDEMVELAKLKIKKARMENSLKEKSDEINRLQRKVRYYEYMKANEISEKNGDKKTNQNPGTQMDNCYEHVIKVIKIYSGKFRVYLTYTLFQEYKQYEVLECLHYGKRFQKYSPEIKMFCFTLNYYSPKSYEYVRKFFDSNLPSIRTIRNWYSSIDATAGFTEGSFNALQQKADELKAKGETLVVSLIHDDVSIRQHSQWSSAEKKFLGHINAGIPGNYDVRTPLAKDAYVLMVSGITEEFKIPIGYFLIAGLCAEERAAILNEAMLKLNNIGVIVGAITNDGHVVNIAAIKILGADYDADKPYFTNPFNKNYIVYSILDPPHMIKLARNCIGNKQVIYDGEDNEILWKFFENLVTLQINQNINFGNKLTRSNIEYQSKKMNVRLAAQTLSNSSASSIEYLDTIMNENDFLGSKGTVQYCRVFNNLFDIMNTKPKHCDERYKRPMSEETINQIRNYFEFSQKYIKGLKLLENNEKKPILQTKSHTPYFGFYHNMISFMGIYKDYIKANGVNEFYTFNVSQDHIECFFACIRRMGGNMVLGFYSFNVH